MQKLLMVLTLAVLAAPLSAQKKCVKGIPCGGTCISAKLTCHVGQDPSRAVSARPDSTSVAASSHFIADSTGSVYYRATCQAAKEIAHPITFSTETAAIASGRKRSKVPGC